ncbi:hypothetical protein AWU65_03435 [Paenibacillus glucanolyticus]|uniref:Uncharacterized protein n=1 Tax=Paenibacillus glucanolyticus TaxID=59843 RepID=A0A163GMK9_9BACL|nr:hypothetical protein AWU65_03435 [Paenibacillus glucanolyticus]OMF66715.1 hypothetical protein BK142_29280 [Paenibacillus glucanolyticus]
MNNYLPKRWVSNQKTIRRETKIMKITGWIVVILIALMAVLYMHDMLKERETLCFIAIAFIVITRFCCSYGRRKKSIKTISALEERAYTKNQSGLS